MVGKVGDKLELFHTKPLVICGLFSFNGRKTTTRATQVCERRRHESNNHVDRHWTYDRLNLNGYISRFQRLIFNFPFVKRPH
jgi:hypothetical protein